MLHDKRRLLLIAEPCSLESEANCRTVATELKALAARHPELNIIFKGSYDKANRTSLGGDLACLLIDEAQFLTPEQVDDLLRIAVLDGIPVLAYGIRTDFRTQAFPGSRRLLEVAHSLEELKTICRCGRKALFNARLVGGRFVFDGDQVAIDEGATGSASPPCCHNVGYGRPATRALRGKALILGQ